MREQERSNDDVRHWFERNELTACPRCGAADAAVTSIGSLYCLGCGELVAGPRDDGPPRAA
ncbi:MAG TPA: hypothetical protein VLN26_03845 [Gaiellaceae bacterium]|nr:hypothetical protein [Gaiellaceae bacterium]